MVRYVYNALAQLSPHIQVCKWYSRNLKKGGTWHKQSFVSYQELYLCTTEGCYLQLYSREMCCVQVAVL